MTLVSAIIPAYNTMKYLPETLDSILAQTYKNFEVIIVNDGSTDHILEWAKQITDSRVRVISQANQGLAGARNSGLREAQGEYIAYLDGDDLWHPTKLAKQVKVLNENPEVGLVYTWVERINEEGKSIGKPFQPELEGKIWEQLLEKTVIAPSSAMIRRSCFDTVGWFDENLKSYVEDWDMWLRISPEYLIKLIREPLLYYRECPGSASKNWQAMEISYGIVLEKAFAKARPELKYLKSRNQGYFYLHLASQALQSQQPNCQTAISYLQKAVSQYPQLWFSQRLMILWITILVVRLLGVDFYRNLQDNLRSVRRKVISST